MITGVHWLSGNIRFLTMFSSEVYLLFHLAEYLRELRGRFHMYESVSAQKSALQCLTHFFLFSKSLAASQGPRTPFPLGHIG